jgi:hypothetical protein
MLACTIWRQRLSLLIVLLPFNPFKHFFTV